MIRRRTFSACLVLLCSAVGCRMHDAPATADPAAATTPRPPASASSTGRAGEGEPKATVTTRTIEIPRAGHDPVVLLLPVVSGLRDARVAAKVDALLDPKNLLGERIDDVREEAKQSKPGETASGVQKATFRVTYEDHGVLQIEASTELLGAYPSGAGVLVLIDLRTGERVSAATALRAEKIAGLVARLDARLKAEVKASEAMRDKDAAPLVRDAKFDAADLDGLEVSAKGVTFHHDYAFPHAVLALVPAGAFFVPWSELVGDLDPKGPLARIAAAR